MTYGQPPQYPPDPPWQPQQYDPAAHRRRIQSPPQEPPWQQAPPPPQDYPPRGQWQPQQPPQDYGQYQPPQPQRRRRSRRPLYAGLAALSVLAAGAAVFTLKHLSSGPAKPLSCKQQYAQWQTGPAKADGKKIVADLQKVQSAANAEDIPETDAALKAAGNDAAALQAYPMPACADPARYWPQMLADLKAAGDNAGSTPGLGGLMTAMAPIQKVKPLESSLSAELARTAGVKSTP